MEDVVAGQLLAVVDHFLSTDDAHIVGCLKLLGSCIRVAERRRSVKRGEESGGQEKGGEGRKVEEERERQGR